MIKSSNTAQAEKIRRLLLSWAEETRKGNHDAVLAGHHPDVLVFDVLAPMKYEGAGAYRASWDDWQPDTEGDVIFELYELDVTAGDDVAFATAFIKCGGTLTNGKSFEDHVRATFCLQRIEERWLVTHQHISKPQG
jgi:ketosteroid isomerase-like protein